MSEDILDILSRSAPAESRERLDATANELSNLALRMAAILNSLTGPCARHDILACVSAKTSDFLVGKNGEPSAMNALITPELREWARREFDKYGEEFLLAEFQEIQTTGGLEFKDFVQELEQEAAP